MDARRRLSEKSTQSTHLKHGDKGSTFHGCEGRSRESIHHFRVLRASLAWSKLISQGDGTAQPSIMASLLEELVMQADAPSDGEDVICNVAAIAYLGGGG